MFRFQCLLMKCFVFWCWNCASRNGTLLDPKSRVENVPSWQTRGTRTGPARRSQRWRSSCRGRRTFFSIEHNWPAPAPCRSRSTPSSQLNTGKFWTNLNYICSNSGLPLMSSCLFWKWLYFTDSFDSIDDPALVLHNRFVGPIGAPELWAGPWWSFQSRVRRPDLCCWGLLAAVGPGCCGDKTCKVSRFFKSPHETCFYWLKWFTELEYHLPHQVIRPGMSWFSLIQFILLLFRGTSAKCACIDRQSPGRATCTHLRTGKTSCDQRWGRSFRSQLPARSWDSFSGSLTRILTSIHAIRSTRVTRQGGGSAAQVGHVTPWLT